MIVNPPIAGAISLICNGSTRSVQWLRYHWKPYNRINSRVSLETVCGLGGVSFLVSGSIRIVCSMVVEFCLNPVLQYHHGGLIIWMIVELLWPFHRNQHT